MFISILGLASGSDYYVDSVVDTDFKIKTLKTFAHLSCLSFL